MKYPCLSLPLGLVLSSVALASAVPQGSSAVAQGTPSLEALSPSALPTNASLGDPKDFVCQPNRRPLSFRYLVLGHCLDAISLFPQDGRHGTFHDNAAPDEWFLPQVRDSQRCTVTIALDYGYHTEESSWQDLTLMAGRLAEKCCLINGLGTGNKRAYVPAGRTGKIKIAMAYRPDLSDDGNVATNAMLSHGENMTSTMDSLLNGPGTMGGVLTA